MEVINKTSSQFKSLTGMTLKDKDFQRVRRMIYSYCGISINEGKEALVQSRLMKRIRKLGIGSFTEYLDLIEKHTESDEFLSFVDVLTTNKTNFFRENKHFEFIKDEILPYSAGKNLKWWSAGCSTGEEPITTVITLLEAQKQYKWNSAKILATDISRDVIKVAKEGVYTQNKIVDIPPALRNKYFTDLGQGNYRVNEAVRKLITYGRLNLTDKWPLKGGFQVIMCRNVMIYFNRQTQEDIVRKFHGLLEPGGYLFLGHSESIPAQALGFNNVAPATYRKR